MSQCHRIKAIIEENGMSQKAFAKSIDVSDSYISKLIKNPYINISAHLLSLISEKYGYSPRWIIDGTEPKYINAKDEKQLGRQNLLISKLETMSDIELLAIEAFLDSLSAVKKLFESTSK